MSKVRKGTKYVSGKVSLIYPMVATPQYYDKKDLKYVNIDSEQMLSRYTKTDKNKYITSNNEELEYCVSILVPKDSNEGKKIKDIVDFEWQEGKKAKAIKSSSNYPIKDGDEEADELESREKNGEYLRGCWLIRAKSNYKPKIVLGKKLIKPTTSDFNIDHNGWDGRVSIVVRWYKFGANSGVSVKLNQICFLEDNPDLDFGGGCDFEIEDEEESTDFGNNKVKVDEGNIPDSCYSDDEEEPPAI